MSITKAKRDKIRKELLELSGQSPDLNSDDIDSCLKRHLAPGLKTSSAKGKARRLQQQLQKRLLQIMANVKETHSVDPDHIRSTPMGVSGEDLMLSPGARDFFPFAFECKNSERIGFWPTVDQAVANAGRYIPVIMFGKNHSDSWMAMPSKAWLSMLESLAHKLRHDEYGSETLLEHLEFHGIIQKEETKRDPIQPDT